MNVYVLIRDWTITGLTDDQEAAATSGAEVHTVEVDQVIFDRWVADWDRRVAQVLLEIRDELDRQDPTTRHFDQARRNARDSDA